MIDPLTRAYSTKELARIKDWRYRADPIPVIISENKSGIVFENNCNPVAGGNASSPPPSGVTSSFNEKSSLGGVSPRSRCGLFIFLV